MRKFAAVVLGLLTTCFTALVVASSAPTDTVQTLDQGVMVQLTTAAFDTGTRWMAPPDAVERVKSGVAQQQASDGTALGLAFNQDGAPIALRGYLASQGSFLYETAKVENLSAKPVSALSFAVLVADPSHRHPPNFLRSSVADVTLLPGKTQDVPVRLLPASQLEDLKRSVSRNLKVTLGVMAVEWADGTEWVFRLPDDAIDFSTGSGLTVPAADQPLNRR